MRTKPILERQKSIVERSIHVAFRLRGNTQNSTRGIRSIVFNMYEMYCYCIVKI